MAQALRRDTQFAYLARKVSPDEAQRVKALELKGVGFVKESRRYYPKKELAAHVLGYVGLDNVGLAGLESTYDAQIRGREGKVLIQTDARRHALNSRVERPATAGAALELTIDQYLQYIAERELRAGVDENRAAGGSAVDHGSVDRRDPRAGQLADVQPERLRPGRRARAAQPRHPGPLRARVDVQGRHRIGGARGARDPARRLIDCAPGFIKIGSRKPIFDVHRYGTLSFTDVIVKSSNVGAIKVGTEARAGAAGPLRQPLRIRPDAEPGLPRREPGHRLEPGAGSNDSALASMSMGYQVGVTPLQMAAAVSSVANGGTLIEPHVVRAFVKNGRRDAGARRRRCAGPCRRRPAPTLTGPSWKAVVERGTAKCGADRRLHHCRQDRHGGKDRRRPLLEVGLQRLVRRLRALAASRR